MEIRDIEVWVHIRTPMSTPPIEGEETVDVVLGKNGYRESKIALGMRALIQVLLNEQVDLLEIKSADVERVSRWGIDTICLPREGFVLRKTFSGRWNLEPI